MWKKIFKFSIPLTICLILIFSTIIAAGCEGEKTTTTTQPTTTQPTTTQPTTPTPTPPEQDEIVIGASRDITGPQAGFQSFGFAPLYKAWADEVNAAN